MCHKKGLRQSLTTAAQSNSCRPDPWHIRPPLMPRQAHTAMPVAPWARSQHGRACSEHVELQHLPACTDPVTVMRTRDRGTSPRPERASMQHSAVSALGGSGHSCVRWLAKRGPWSTHFVVARSLKMPGMDGEGTLGYKSFLGCCNTCTRRNTAEVPSVCGTLHGATAGMCCCWRAGKHGSPCSLKGQCSASPITKN